MANQTSASFLRVVGSELIQKYLGDGPKLVRELFRVADELSPSIVFIGGVFLLSSLLHGALAACKHSRVACRMPERTAGIGPCLKHAEAWLVLPGACTCRATCDGSTAAAAQPRSSTSHLRQTCAADEIDAIGTKRYEATSGGEREIQRTMLELLNQLDGFDSMGDVKVGDSCFLQQVYVGHMLLACGRAVLILTSTTHTDRGKECTVVPLENRECQSGPRRPDCKYPR